MLTQGKTLLNPSKSLFWWASPKDPATAYHFAKILKQHEIKFHELKNTVKKEGKIYHPESSYVIPLEQKKHALIQAFFQ